MFCSPIHLTWDLTIHPLGSVLAGIPLVSGFNTICTSPTPLLADIVIFGFSLKVLERV